MPNRIVREGILTSDKVAQVGPMAELFFRRLMSIVDDFGRYYAKIPVLLSVCYPIRPVWADEESLSLWVEECCNAGLIDRYCVSSTFYIEIVSFGQRLKQDQKSKFPANPGKSGNFRENPGNAGSRASSSTPNTATPPTPQAPPNRAREVKDESFEKFRAAFAETGCPTQPGDWTDAYRFWKVLDFEQKLAACDHVKTCDGAHVRLPKNYLEHHEWERRPRPVARAENGKKSKIQEMIDSL